MPIGTSTKPDEQQHRRAEQQHQFQPGAPPGPAPGRPYRRTTSPVRGARWGDGAFPHRTHDDPSVTAGHLPVSRHRVLRPSHDRLPVCPGPRSSWRRRRRGPGRRRSGTRCRSRSGCRASTGCTSTPVCSLGSVSAEAAAGLTGRPIALGRHLLLHVDAVDVLQEVGTRRRCGRGAGEAVTAAERDARVALAAGHRREREPAHLGGETAVRGQRRHRAGLPVALQFHGGPAVGHQARGTAGALLGGRAEEAGLERVGAPGTPARPGPP